MAVSFVVSGIAAALGTTAIAATVLLPATDDDARVWIDAPLVGAVRAPGAVTVTAHGTDRDTIEGLTLTVDGKVVAEDRTLRRSGLLVFATFRWSATAGTHRLVVTQGDGGTSSEPRFVTIDGGDAPPEVEATPTPTPSATTATPTPTPTPTPTATTPAPPEVEAPVIEAAAFVGTPVVHEIASCPYRVQVQAVVIGATEARAVISGVGSVPLARDGSDYTGVVASGFPAGEVGDHTVTVVATGPGGSSTTTVGTLTIRSGCPKD